MHDENELEECSECEGIGYFDCLPASEDNNCENCQGQGWVMQGE